MPFHKRPPRGYSKQEFPLPHQFEYHGGLTAHTSGQYATNCTLLRTSENITNIDTVVVNPSHDSFAEETGATIAPQSIVPKLMLDMRFEITKLAIAAGIKTLDLLVYPLYTAFINTFDAEDVRVANSQVEDIMELDHVVGSKMMRPLWTGTDLAFQTAQPLNTVLGTAETFSNWGLTTDAKLEGVAFDENLYHDALSYFSNQGMLRKVVGKPMVFHLTHEHGKRFFSHNFTHPTVKRGNPYTSCSLLIYLRPLGARSQWGRVGDSTAIDHVDFNINVRYDEWNSDFDQTAF